MKIYNIDKLSESMIDKLCVRSSIDDTAAKAAAQIILEKVRSGSDKALFELGREYDKAELDSLEVSDKEIKGAVRSIRPELKKAFKTAADNITKFHEAQLYTEAPVETMPGVLCFAECRPIERVGLYIPGGTASLPSTVLMLAIPAGLAGCADIILCTPPDEEGKVDPAVLYAADLCGIDKIYKLGGAQAIGAMAYGSESVPKVFKIFGPGNRYVTAAKQLVSIDPAGAAIDMPAGPTEVLVVADGSSRADFAAADLLSQAEHGPDSMAVLVCTDGQKTDRIMAEVEKQLKDLPRRDIAKEALKNSYVLMAKDLDQAVDFANRFAPEHLILGFDDADRYTDKVISAGSVFIGPYSSESAGDYASGTNHSLPTYGYARTYSGVSVASFQKRITFQKVSRQGAKNLGPAVQLLAGHEGLTAHKRAMEIRQ